MKATFIQVYAPTADTSDDEFNSFFAMTYKSHSTASPKRTMLSFWETSMLGLVFTSPYGKIP